MIFEDKINKLLAARKTLKNMLDDLAGCDWEFVMPTSSFGSAHAPGHGNSPLRAGRRSGMSAVLPLISIGVGPVGSPYNREYYGNHR